jgi:hypothetical protein
MLVLMIIILCKVGSARLDSVQPYVHAPAYAQAASLVYLGLS